MVIQIKDLTENNAINLSVLLKNNKIKNDKFCCLDFSNVRETTPSGMLLLGEVIKNFIKINPNVNFEFKVASDNQNTNYAGNMGFFNYISAENINFGEKADTFSSIGICVPITKINFYNYTKSWTYSHMSPTQYIEFQAENFAKILSKEKNIQNLLVLIITEIMRNSEEHANVDNVYICAHKIGKYIEFAILDNGRGFKSSLKTKLKKTFSDESAIKLSLIPGATQPKSFIPEEENGFGLYVTSEMCNLWNGSFSIISGDTAIVSRKETKVTKSAYLKGTCIRVLIDSTLQLNFSEKLGEIIEKGRLMQSKL